MMLSRHRRIIPSLERSSKRCTYMSILDRFQIIQQFAQCRRRYTKFLCTCFFTMSPVCHCLYPKPPERYTTLYHLGIYAWDDVVLTQQPKAVVLQSRALFAWIEEADQTSQILCLDDPQEARMADIDCTQLERVHTKASSKIKRLGRSVSQRRMPRETEKPPLTMNDGKPTNGTSTSKKDQDGHGMMKSENFYRGPNPDDELKDFFDEMVMEWWMLIFSDIFLGVRTHVVATAVCTTGCVHTLTCCTHIFLHIARAQSSSHIFMRVHIHARLKCL